MTSTLRGDAFPQDGVRAYSCPEKTEIHYWAASGEKTLRGFWHNGERLGDRMHLIQKLLSVPMDQELVREKFCARRLLKN